MEMYKKLCDEGRWQRDMLTHERTQHCSLRACQIRQPLRMGLCQLPTNRTMIQSAETHAHTHTFTHLRTVSIFMV